MKTETNNLVAAKALLMVADAVVETVTSANGSGVSGGLLFTALQTQGCTIDQFQMLMSVLCETGKVRKSGELYFGINSGCGRYDQARA